MEQYSYHEETGKITLEKKTVQNSENAGKSIYLMSLDEFLSLKETGCHIASGFFITHIWSSIMLKKFIKYVSQNMLGMVGMSVYILADTYFISVAVGADGITALNLVLPIYNIIFAIGAMMGVGSAIRFVVERNKKSPDADGYFFHALVWAFIISLFFIFVGLFLPDKLIALLGGDAQIVATGKNYTRIFMCFAPFFIQKYRTDQKG
jgi:Na+-driven multidrug efflux pump